MPKIKIKTSLKNDIEEIKEQTNAKLDKDKISYYEKSKTKVIYNYKNNVLTRDNNEINMIYTFNKNKETTGKILIKELNKELNVKIKTEELKQKDHNLEVKFIVENQTFIYKIEVKEN
ncbi:MAG: hypothetical protein IJF92_02720 [Bacilli bacterium]|nr:hypothetical protein [Bacilli bacterium]